MVRRTPRHGGKGTRLYECWKHMRGRCNNPFGKNFADYGGRNIWICAEWDAFSAFRDWALANGYAAHLTLDRIDNNDGYYPGNCKWSTRKQQANNRRNTINVEAFGEMKTVAMWASDPRCMVAAPTLYYRINSGWPGERALTTLADNANRNV